MKFTDGYWMTREGYQVLHPASPYDIWPDEESGTLTVFAPTSPIRTRGDVLNRPVVTITYSSPARGVVKVRVEHHQGVPHPGPRFEVAGEDGFRPEVEVTEEGGVLRSGDLEVRVRRRESWQVDFVARGRTLTSSLPKSVGIVTGPGGGRYVHEQLSLRPGERVYGLGERFGAFVKNGQEVDIWNADGGTSSEQAYKNVPFYVTSEGYGVFVDHPERVSFEVASEVVTRTQFSVEGERLDYYVIDGPTPKDVLTRYTAMTGRPARVPPWSFGLWLTTSFTTSYDETTVTEFIDGMAERDLPLSVFHFDCFWMRELNWCDFEWDPRTFPDPEAMLARYKARGLRICVWINPYIAQRSPLFAEGLREGYLVRTTDGGVWQTDLWQAGTALVDFTNPAATAWFTGKLARLVDMGVDSFKTDFGERIPTDGVVYHDGSDPKKMHNYYTHLYNRAVFELLEERNGAGGAVLFARSATAGGQQFPVHWGGDCDSTFASMGETLRGGLSLAMSGFGLWSHDIGGFEGTPDPAVFKRWLAFGLLSSHARMHGSSSVRVPWAFDDEAVTITRDLTRLRLRLVPYLAGAAEQAHLTGVPVLRPMVLEFPGDRATYDIDTQYMLGDSLLVAPVFTAEGDVELYVPEGRWTSLLDGTTVVGPRWVRQEHAMGSLPLYVRPDTVLPVGAHDDGPEYDWADGLTLRLFEIAEGHDSVTRVPAPGGGASATFRVRRTGSTIVVESSDAASPWSVEHDGRTLTAVGAARLTTTVGGEL